MIGKNGKISSEDVFSEKEINKEMLDVADIIGEDGKWQRKIFYMTLVCNITTAWNHLGISFLAFPVDYWCSRPQGMNISFETWKSQFLPNITIGGEISKSQCETWTYNFSTDDEIYFQNQTQKCNAWEYSSNYYSIVEQVSEKYCFCHCFTAGKFRKINAIIVVFL